VELERSAFQTDEAKAAVAVAQSAFGTLHGLVNCAGIAIGGRQRSVFRTRRQLSKGESTSTRSVSNMTRL
jgi:NAD(P)-dependent dehydrogenase (short-subunit alcohol dehydrogenase family)